MSVFGTSWGDCSAQAGTWAMGAGMWDNMIAYETPSFAGFKVFAQYGMGNQVSDEYSPVTGVDVEKTWGGGKKTNPRAIATTPSVLPITTVR